MNQFEKLYKIIMEETNYSWSDYDHSFYNNLSLHNQNNKLQLDFMQSIITPQKQLVQNIIDNYKFNLKYTDDYVTYLQIPEALLENQQFVDSLSEEQRKKLIALKIFNNGFDVDEYLESQYDQQQVQRIKQWKNKIGIKF